MKINEYLAGASPEVEVDVILRTIAGDRDHVRVFPTTGPRGTLNEGVVVHRSDIVDVTPIRGDAATIVGARVGNAVKVKLRVGELASQLTDEVYPIDWQSLEETRVLPDGDRIHVTYENLPPDTLGGEIRLILGPDVSWWKQVDLYRYDGSYHLVARVEASDDHANHDASFTNGNLENGRVVLWKAKEFGLKKPKYMLSNVAERMNGKRTTFTWLDD